MRYPAKYTNTCIADHRRSFTLFGAARSRRWWRKHYTCNPKEK